MSILNYFSKKKKYYYDVENHLVIIYYGVKNLGYNHYVHTFNLLFEDTDREATFTIESKQKNVESIDLTLFYTFVSIGLTRLFEDRKQNICKKIGNI